MLSAVYYSCLASSAPSVLSTVKRWKSLAVSDRCSATRNALPRDLICPQDYESLKEHIKGEAVKEFIKYTAKVCLHLQVDLLSDLHQSAWLSTVGSACRGTL